MKKLICLLFICISLKVFSQEHKQVMGSAYGISTSGMGSTYTFSACFVNNGDNYMVALETMHRHLKLLKFDNQMNVVKASEIPFKKDVDCSFINAFYMDGNLYVWYNFTESSSKDEKLMVKKVSLETLKYTEKEVASLTKKEFRNGSGFEVMANQELKLLAGLAKHVTKERSEQKLDHYTYTIDYKILDKELETTTSNDGTVMKTGDEEQYYASLIGNKEHLIINTTKPVTPEVKASKSKGKVVAAQYKAHIISGATVKKVKLFAETTSRGLYAKYLNDSCIAYFAIKTTNGVTAEALTYCNLNFVSRKVVAEASNECSVMAEGNNATSTYNVGIKGVLNELQKVTEVIVDAKGGYVIFCENAMHYSNNAGSVSSPSNEDVSRYGPGVVIACDADGKFDKITLLDYSYDKVGQFVDFGRGGYIKTAANGDYILITYGGYILIDMAQEMNEIVPFKSAANGQPYWVVSDGKTVFMCLSKGKTTAFSRVD